MSSSRRFKEDIEQMNQASESILGLRPVSFHYKSDKTHTPQFGLIAEDVAEVNPALVIRDSEGKPYTVRYEQVNAMLLNEFLKEHRKVQELESTVAKHEAAAAKQEHAIAQQQNQIQALVAGLQKVRAQLATRSASRVVDLK
jgi:predicted ribosome quality control (RQC) complex YloA/Tae2 family protein